MQTPGKMKLSMVVVATVLALGLSLPSHADGESTIRAGVFVNPVGVVGAVEYERLLGYRFSIGARLGYIDYDYKDGTYTETGNGPGVEFLVRYYPQGKGHKGFYVGGAVGHLECNLEAPWSFRQSRARQRHLHRPGCG